MWFSQSEAVLLSTLQILREKKECSWEFWVNKYPEHFYYLLNGVLAGKTGNCKSFSWIPLKISPQTDRGTGSSGYTERSSNRWSHAVALHSKSPRSYTLNWDIYSTIRVKLEEWPFHTGFRCTAVWVQSEHLLKPTDFRYCSHEDHCILVLETPPSTVDCRTPADAISYTLLPVCQSHADEWTKKFSADIFLEDFLWCMTENRKKIHKLLYLSQTNPFFNVSADQVFRKRCGKRRNCL